MGTTTDQVRAWNGPALLSYGFRPFFLLGALWAAIAMALWVLTLAGAVTLPTAFDPVAWHAHELLFGYLVAVVAGFLLTAVPNWTGRPPIVGWPLAGLVVAWLLGRLAVAFSAALSPLAVAALDLLAPVLLGAVLAREIVAGRNWRNLVVLAMLAVLTAGNAAFHWEAARGLDAARGGGLRLGLAAGLMMIVVIGGRIVPAFTRNWLVRRGGPQRPAATDRFDGIVLVVSAATLIVWVAAPDARATGVALLAAGALQLARLARWSGLATGAEPLVWILHVGYGFVPLGSLALGVATLDPRLLDPAAAQHLWMAGAIGTMTLAVMSRATLGHTGGMLAASPGTTAIYAALLASVLLRFGVTAAPAHAGALRMAAGLLWCGAFLGFAALYGPALVRPRP